MESNPCLGMCHRRPMIISLLLSAILLALGLLHFHWALGGKFGFDLAVPTRENGQRVLNPGKVDCVVVGMALVAFGAFYLIKSGVVDLTLMAWPFTYAGWVIPSIFLIRAIGEFRYVGFFKRVKTTDFAKQDTRLFSPLCLLIAIMGITVQVMG